MCCRVIQKSKNKKQKQNNTSWNKKKRTYIAHNIKIYRFLLCYSQHAAAAAAAKSLQLYSKGNFPA